MGSTVSRQGYRARQTQEQSPGSGRPGQLFQTADYPFPNPIHRFAIGDRDKLAFNADGSLDILIQHESPGKEKESNWLPAPKGPFQVMMRMYLPKPEVLRDGPGLPPIKKIQ